MSPIRLDADFDGAEAPKNACREYAIQNAVEFRTVRSPNMRYLIACKVTNCPWRLYATSVEKSSIFRIRRLSADHSCFGLQHTGNQEATYAFLAEYLSERLKDNPAYCPVEIMSDVRHDLGVGPSVFPPVWCPQKNGGARS